MRNRGRKQRRWLRTATERDVREGGGFPKTAEASRPLVGQPGNRGRYALARRMPPRRPLPQSVPFRMASAQATALNEDRTMYVRTPSRVPAGPWNTLYPSYRPADDRWRESTTRRADRVNGAMQYGLNIFIVASFEAVGRGRSWGRVRDSLG